MSWVKDDDSNCINILDHLAHGLVFNMSHTQDNLSTPRANLDSDYHENEPGRPESSLSTPSSSIVPADELDMNEPALSDYSSNPAELSNYYHGDFPESTMEAVVFPDVDESYPIGTDIKCSFTIDPMVQMKRGDKIVVLPHNCNLENWPHHCIATVMAFQCETEECPYTMRKIKFSKEDTIKAHFDLPYQFFYIDEDGKILGQSAPFSFRHPNAEEFIEMENTGPDPDGDGFVVVTSRETLIWDRCQQLIRKYADLDFTKNQLEAELKKKNLEFNEMKKAMSSTKQAHEKLVEKMKEMLQYKARAENAMAKLIGELEAERNLTRQKDQDISELNETISSMRKSAADKDEQSNEKIAQLRSQIEDLMSAIETHERNKEIFRIESENLNAERTKVEKRLEEVQEAFDEYKANSENQKKEAEKAHFELLKEKNRMRNENKDLKLRLGHAKKAYEDVYKEKDTAEVKLTKLQSKVEKLKLKESLFKTREQGKSILKETEELLRLGGACGGTDVSSDSPETFVQTFVQTEPKIVESFEEAMTKSEQVSSTNVSDDTRRSAMIPCPECSVEIDCSDGHHYSPMLNHLEKEHNRLICPFCGQAFDSKTANEEDNYFQLHVENHFEIPQDQ